MDTEPVTLGEVASLFELQAAPVTPTYLSTYPSSGNTFTASLQSCVPMMTLPCPLTSSPKLQKSLLCRMMASSREGLDISVSLISPSNTVIACEEQLGSAHPQKPHETNEEHVYTLTGSSFGTKHSSVGETERMAKVWKLQQSMWPS